MSSEVLESTTTKSATIRMVVFELNSSIGPGTVSMIASDLGLFESLKWAQAGATLPSAEEELRILKLHEIWTALSSYNADKAYSWILMLNPLLDGRSPARAIKENLLDEVTAAAQRFIASYN